MSLKCSVPGCPSKSENANNEIYFYTVQSEARKSSRDPLREKRKREWINAVHGGKVWKKFPFDVVVCSKHFVTGRPALEMDVDNVDWVPSVKLSRICEPEAKDPVDNIIENLPEVITSFDVPEYIFFGQLNFRDTVIEKHLVEKYLTNPICDENGYYNNDHDYLGLPLAPIKTETHRNNTSKDHSYSISSQPACRYFDSRHFCNICSFNSDNIFSFNKHLMAHTLRNHVSCRFCFQKCLTSTCLNNHLTTHTTLCDQCGNEIPTVQLKGHQLVNDQQKLKNPETKRYKVAEKNKTHFCVRCMNMFYSLKNFENHMCFKKAKILKRLKMS